LGGFLKGLGETGYVEGRNVTIEYRWTDFQSDRLTGLAAELVNRRVAVIVATAGEEPALAAKTATATIPIVFSFGGDPVELGLVESLNRPGGNITGVSFLIRELTPKRLELLHEMVPGVTSIGYLFNPASRTTEAERRDAEVAGRSLGVRLVLLGAKTPSEIDAAFATLAAEQVGALLVDSDPLFFRQREQLAALAASHLVPAVYFARGNVVAGGLMSYGANITDAYRVVGTYVGRILKGEKPADLPVQRSTKVELIINLKTAKALSLDIPATLYARADEVIE
jgi:putative ABC transport system substrate-binding protein